VLKLVDLLLKTAADLLADAENGLVDDPVEDPVAIPAAADDACVREHTKVLGNVLLGGLERLGELAHRQLLFAETIKDADPHRLTDRTKATGDQVDERIWKRVGKRHVFLNYTTK
jgi:hypothetical protein